MFLVSTPRSLPNIFLGFLQKQNSDRGRSKCTKAQRQVPTLHNTCLPVDPPQEEEKRKRDVTCFCGLCFSCKEHVLVPQEGTEELRRRRHWGIVCWAEQTLGGQTFGLSQCHTSAGRTGEGSTEWPRGLGGGQSSLGQASKETTA